jgi:hypothetical protein
MRPGDDDVGGRFDFEQRHDEIPQRGNGLGTDSPAWTTEKI